MEPIIEIKNLTHIYSPNTPFEQRALDSVNLTIYQGETLGIIGRTGSGKSTLIQHLNGLLEPTSGKVYIDGQDLGSDSLRGTGYLEQQGTDPHHPFPGGVGFSISGVSAV